MSEQNIKKNRVVVTGMGAITPIGCTPEALWQNLMDQVCGIGPIQAFDTDAFKVKLAAEIHDDSWQEGFDRRELKFTDRFCQLARAAARHAFQNAGLDEQICLPERMGVIFGTGIGGLATIESCKQVLDTRGPGRISPYFIPMSLTNLAAGQIAIDLQAKGYVSSVTTACAASANAIGEAFRRIQEGLEDVMIAGGSEAAITPLGIGGFQAMHALYTGDDPLRASIPFDRERSGFVMGEGAGALVLESLDHAQARQAHIYGEIVGYGASCDASHITAPQPGGSGAAAAMEKALTCAGLSPQAIDYINAHGTSTKLNDAAESQAVAKVFGSHPICMSSTKSSTGHLLGAAGAVEAVICLEALNHQTIPATIHISQPDPSCHQDIAANAPRPADLQYVMSNSLGFGGHNISLIFAGGSTHAL